MVVVSATLPSVVASWATSATASAGARLFAPVAHVSEGEVGILAFWTGPIVVVECASLLSLPTSVIASAIVLESTAVPSTLATVSTIASATARRAGFFTTIAYRSACKV